MAHLYVDTPATKRSTGVALVPGMIHLSSKMMHVMVYNIWVFAFFIFFSPPSDSFPSSTNPIASLITNKKYSTQPSPSSSISSAVKYPSTEFSGQKEATPSIG